MKPQIGTPSVGSQNVYYCLTECMKESIEAASFFSLEKSLVVSAEHGKRLLLFLCHPSYNLNSS